MRQEPLIGLNIKSLWSKTGGLALVRLLIHSYTYSTLNQLITYEGLNIVSLLCQSLVSYDFYQRGLAGCFWNKTLHRLHYSPLHI